MDAPTAELIAHPLFSVLSAAAQQAVRGAVVRRRVHRQEIIYSPGGSADAVYWVRRGHVKVSRLSSDGREITLALCHSGELFGEEGVFLRGPRSCQAQALEESTLLALPALVLCRLLRDEADFAVGLMGLIGKRSRDLEDQVEHLAFLDVGGRLAGLLLSLAERQSSRLDDGRTLLLHTRLTHQELANCVGTTRETLTLTFDRFKADGWIRLEGRMIAICEPEALSTRARNGRSAGGAG